MTRAPQSRLHALPAAAAALLFAVAAGAGSLPPDAPLIAALDACIAGLEREAGADGESPDIDRYLDFEGLDEEPDGAPRAKQQPFAERCPEARAELAGSALAIHLPPDWDRRMTAGKLVRYRALLTAPPPATGRRPATDRVAAIVQETEAAVQVQRRSLWQRFKDWLRAWLERGDRDSNAGWLARWLDEHFPSAKVIRTILYSILAGMIALAGWIVYAELRAAGVLERWRRQRGAGGLRAESPAAAPAPPTLAGASETEAPSILLALLLGELRRLGRVQDRSSMTHRELARAVRFEGAERDAFGQLLGAAERLRYGAAPPPAAALRASIEAGSRLLASLSREAGAAA